MRNSCTSSISKETFGLWPSWSYRRTSGDRLRRVAELMPIQVSHSNISTHHIPSDTINRATIRVLNLHIFQREAWDLRGTQTHLFLIFVFFFQRQLLRQSIMDRQQGKVLTGVTLPRASAASLIINSGLSSKKHSTACTTLQLHLHPITRYARSHFLFLFISVDCCLCNEIPTEFV